MGPSRNYSGKNFLTICPVFVAVYCLFLPAICLAQPPPQNYPREADLAVNNVFLKFRKSSEDVLGREITSAPKEGYDQLICLSENGAERLVLIKRKAAEQNSFHRFVLSKNTQPPNGTTCRVKGSFRSFRGVVIGMSVADITKIFGSDYRVESGKGLLTMRYSLENSISSDFLQYYQELRYYSYYRFKDGKLVEFSFGFDPIPESFLSSS